MTTRRAKLRLGAAAALLWGVGVWAAYLGLNLGYYAEKLGTFGAFLLARLE